jgi:ligand-binding sensor protein
MDSYDLVDIVDKHKLSEILSRFTEATGLAAIITDRRGRNIIEPSNFTRHCTLVRSTERGKRGCYVSDARLGKLSVEKGEPAMEKCHCDIVDLAAPLIAEGRCYGYALCGQVFIGPPDDKSIEKAKMRAKLFGVDANEYLDAFMEIKVIPQSQVLSAGEILHIFSNYIVELGANSIIQRRLLEEQYKRFELESIIKSLELKVLQSQINPHFIFNTLNMAARLGYLENAKQTSEVIYSLASLLRYSLKSLDQFISLREEISYVEHFLYIQKTRYNDRIKTKVSIPEILQEYLIPIMSIQPIVENAFKHGLEDKSDGGILVIDVFDEGNALVIYIIDNGVGISSQKLEEINNPMYQITGHTTGFGISNVDLRFKRYFGQEYGVTIESMQNVGTKVKLRFPKTIKGG